MDGKSCLMAILSGDSTGALEAIEAGVSPDLTLGEVLGWDWPMHNVGPTLLYLAALSAEAATLIPAMLAAGGSVDKEWIFNTEWDNDDLYLYTSEVSVLRSAQAYAAGETDYFKRLYDDDKPAWSGNVQMRELGLFGENGDALLGPPTTFIVSMLVASAGSDEG